MNVPTGTTTRTDPQEYLTRPAPDTLRLERLLPGPIERVWSYLTDSEKRGQWLASGEMDLRVGGPVEHVFDNSNLAGQEDPPPAKYARHASPSTLRGRVTACEPPHLLAYTWGESSGTDSLVTFELQRQGEQVLLVLTHSRIVAHDDLIGAAAGWHTHIGILADRLAGRQPPRFWPTHTRLEAEYEQRIPRT
ncbi:MAG TPA: SRPBCC family protein [Woeseiaceae bacterium]|nr:SRPBCC family protein [Woeseiaceae bacterium]